MRCRQTLNNGTIVWFGSSGKNPDGTAIKNNSFVDEQEGVKSTLLQKLHVFKNELWYSYNFGLPLFSKVKSKTELDMYIFDIVYNTHDVITIEDFSSDVINGNYICNMVVITNFGKIDISI